MKLSFKNWINEEISRQDLEKALSGVITQITTTRNQGNAANKNNTTKVISAVGDVNRNIDVAKTDIQKDLDNNKKSLVQILTGSNRTPNPSEKPEASSDKLASKIAQTVLGWFQAREKEQNKNTNTNTNSPPPTTTTSTKPPGV